MKHRWRYALPALAFAAQAFAQTAPEPAKPIDVRAARAGLAGSWRGELAYRDYLTQELPQHEFLGEYVSRQMLYYPTVTREPFERQGRIPHLVQSGQMARELGLPQLNPETDRVMICGSPAMLRDLKAMCERLGFV